MKMFSGAIHTPINSAMLAFRASHNFMKIFTAGYFCTLKRTSIDCDSDRQIVSYISL